MIRRKLALWGTAGALAVGAVAVPAFAHDANLTDEERAAKQAEREAARDEKQQAFADSLAEKLGIESGDVAAALEELRTERKAEMQAKALERLDQALADEKITQEQYDTMKERIEAGEFPRQGMRGRRGPGGEGRMGPGHRGHGPGTQDDADDAGSADDTGTADDAAAPDAQTSSTSNA